MSIYSDRLALVRTAIDSLLAGTVQSYDVEGFGKVTKLNLAELQAYEAKLTRMVERESRGGGIRISRAQPR
ncbi:MAG: hypothetical protein VYD87_16400 [Pseudomonadota bacterium]|nr:hypothetical protein [Pseudomonadota bacterium]MEE3100446.1 hypothetical protein [Pseudomonadota bacterium]